jgi:hypothetical protein
VSSKHLQLAACEADCKEGAQRWSEFDLAIQLQDLVRLTLGLGSFGLPFRPPTIVFGRPSGSSPLPVRLRSQGVSPSQKSVYELGAGDGALAERAPPEVSPNLRHDFGVSLGRGSLILGSGFPPDPAEGVLGTGEVILDRMPIR